MTLYVDIIFLENIFMNCIILLATGIILKDQTRIIRNLIASVIGSIYAIIIYVSNIEIYSNVFLKLILSFVIVYIAFKPLNIKSLFKHIVIFYLTSFTFGGVAFALLYFVRPQDILYENGVLIGTYPIKIILIGGILGFIIITISFKNIKGKFTKRDMFCTIKLFVENKQIQLRAIIDTGNLLKDPITNSPVIVVEKNKLINFFPKIIIDNTTKIINGEQIDLDKYASKIRVIPFNSLGKENGMLLGIKIEKMEIEYQDVLSNFNNTIIGIYNGLLSKNGKYSALIGLSLIEG